MDVKELIIKATLQDEERAQLVRALGLELKEIILALLPHLQSSNYSDINPKIKQEPLLSKEEACKFFGCSKPTLTKRIAEGKIRAHRMGRRVYFFKSELISAMESPFKRKA